MALSNDLNDQGRRYDAFMPYRLIITITKADKKGELLQRLAHGTIIGHASKESAAETEEGFIELATAILTSNYGTAKDRPDFSSYGMVAIVHEPTGDIILVRHIGH